MATTYKVKKGDTLSGIASRYGTTVSALAKANNIKNPNLIYAGNTLTIPGSSGSTKRRQQRLKQPPPQPPRHHLRRRRRKLQRKKGGAVGIQ